MPSFATRNRFALGPAMQMPGFAEDQMTDREIDQIIAYLAHMAKRGETR